MQVLTGAQLVKIDSAGRLALPAAYRNDLVQMCTGSVFLTLSPTLNCALLMPDQFWLAYEQKLQAQRNHAEMSAWMRRLYGNLTEITINDSGRLLLPLPQMLCAVIGTGKKDQVVVSGSGAPYLEIWQEANWLEYMQSAMAEGAAAEDRDVLL